MKQYVYRVRDYSILTPAFKQFILFPLAARFPRWIPANIITIISNLCIYATLGVSALLEPFPLLRFITLALLVFIYLTGDHLDGLQAKRTGTSSPLGEFVDHYMDAYNNIIYLLVDFSVFISATPILFPLSCLSVIRPMPLCFMNNTALVGWFSKRSVLLRHSVY